MKSLSQDLSIYENFNFDKPPVAVKFVANRPKGMEKLDKSLAICEMLREAQQSGEPFYADKENENCFGSVVTGMEEAPPFATSGRIGAELGIFQEERANSRIYNNLPKLIKGTVKYIAFSRLDKLSFEPDLLFIMAKPSQAEIVLRAMSYSTGEIWEPKTTNVLGCAWLFAYPLISGKVNYTITGMSFGMKAKQVFPEGWVLISIPYNWIPVITKNLNEMEWVLPSYSDGVEKFKEREAKLMERLFEED